MPLRWALLVLWAACSSGARNGDNERRSPSAAANKEKRAKLDEDQDRVTELRDAGYDPKVAARMMWWSTKAAYFKYKVGDRKIGLRHLRGKVRLAYNNEVAVLRDGSNAYVIFRGSVMGLSFVMLTFVMPTVHEHLYTLLILTPQTNDDSQGHTHPSTGCATLSS